jgi:hypothetical protein
MTRMSFGKVAIAATTFACATLFSVGWTEQGGVSLSVDSAQARIGRPLTPVSVAGVARRHARRAAYGYGYGYGAGVVGAGVVAAGAVAATTVAAATSPWGYENSWAYQGNGSSAAGGWYASSPWGDYECRGDRPYVCQPFAAKTW